MIRVDAHHHVWRIARGDYTWLKPDAPIYRNYTLDDLRPLLGDISATVLVQAAATEAETAFMLEQAHNSSGLVRGVVGWADLARGDAPARIAALAGDPLLKGLRPMLQDIADTGWIISDAVQPALQAMVREGLRFDALIQPRHLPTLLTLCERYPDMPVVIDHGAKPAIAARAWQPWADDISRIAHETQAMCKISGLLTEAENDCGIDDIRHYTDHLLACFGPHRLMWGSDWPVVELAGGYRRWREASEQLFVTLSATESDTILGGNAAAFYGLAGSANTNG